MLLNYNFLLFVIFFMKFKSKLFNDYFIIEIKKSPCIAARALKTYSVSLPGYNDFGIINFTIRQNYLQHIKTIWQVAGFNGCTI